MQYRYGRYVPGARNAAPAPATQGAVADPGRPAPALALPNCRDALAGVDPLRPHLGLAGGDSKPPMASLAPRLGLARLSLGTAQACGWRATHHTSPPCALGLLANGRALRPGAPCPMW